MADPITKMIAGIMPQSGVMFGLVLMVAGIFLMVAAYFIYNLMKWRPIIYKATVFEKIGKKFRVYHTKVLYKVKPDEKGYYVHGQKLPIGGLSKDDAYLGGKGKGEFFLLQLEQKFFPMTINKQIAAMTGNKKKLMDLDGFVTEARLLEIDRASVEAVKKDNKKFEWVDKLSAFLQFAAPMIVIIMAFVIVGWAAKSNAGTTAEIASLKVEFVEMNANWGRIAGSFEVIGQYFGGVGKVPPG